MFAAEASVRAVLGMLMVWGGLSAAQAQVPPSAAQQWQGEWGAMERSHGGPRPAYTGGRLSLSACTAQSCTMEMRVAPRPDAYCEASGELTLENMTTAVAHLSFADPSRAALASQDDESCVLTLTRDAAGAIGSAQRGAGCSYYCTPGGSFLFTFPRRSEQLFQGDDRDACYAPEDAAQSAVCSDAALSGLDREWRERSHAVGELLRLPETTVETPAQSCAAATAVAECLRAAYSKQLDELRQAAAQWRAAETSPGDAQQAAQKLRAIVGRYRKPVANGDISGRHATTTDLLTLRRASKTSVAYAVELSFANGHQCSRSGTAEYRQSGSFVEESRGAAETANGGAQPGALQPECFFEIRPTARGVELADPTGICRQSDCGARGGYAGEAFSFAQRIGAGR
jgi:hypothetical protein